jgi:hypothetical protein
LPPPYGAASCRWDPDRGVSPLPCRVPPECRTRGQPP